MHESAATQSPTLEARYPFWPGSTIFPTQLAMACSWDAELVERMARVTAVEVAASVSTTQLWKTSLTRIFGAEEKNGVWKLSRMVT